MQDHLMLVPAPRHLVRSDGDCKLNPDRLILLDHENPQALLFTALRFQRALQFHCGLHWEAVASMAVPGNQVGLEIHVRPDQNIPDQGYELSITPHRISLHAGDLAGAFYGVCTLIQLIDRCGHSLPCLRVTDWPDFPVRGVMLDVSRERVPTMQTLFNLVDELAGWKINQFQLYTEHAFAYRHHAQVWEMVTPITGQEVMELDVYCRERSIELVPNQQSLGHLAPWLNLPSYKHLAEVEDGFQTPYGYRRGSFSLSPIDPQTIEFLRGLYAELLPHFSSRMFNVGCDETWDVGQGRSKDACERFGKGRVYLDFLLQIYREVKRFGRTPQFWGDVIIEHPDLISELPKDMIVLEWGYEADHPFDLHGNLFASSGLPFYVCPGTSSWCSLSGRTDNAVANLLSAAENGLKHGAVGYLNTDWGDYGHWQAWPTSFLGLMAGAAYSWALENNRNVDIAKSLSWHGFRDASGEMGRLAFDLGNIYQVPGISLHNSSIYFWILQYPLEQIRSYPGLSSAVFQNTLQAIGAAAEPLERAHMEHPDRDLIREEFRYTIRLLRHACLRGLLAVENDPYHAKSLKHELNVDLAEVMDAFRLVWLQRNRPGGLAESMARLERLRTDYISTD